MSVARSLERRLERLIDGAGRVFSGRLHPSELAGRLAREADFARFDHPTGPATANVFNIEVHPDDLSVDPTKLERMLAAEMTAYTAEEGLRLEGPVRVSIRPSASASPGKINCSVAVESGPPVVWARLTSKSESFEIGRNRALLGRSPDVDVVIDHDDVSRRHALVYRERGEVWIRDLSSANGTWVDGDRLGQEAHRLQQGSVVRLADRRYRFVGTV